METIFIGENTQTSYGNGKRVREWVWGRVLEREWVWRWVWERKLKQDCQIPKTLTELRGFLCLCEFEMKSYLKKLIIWLHCRSFLSERCALLLFRLFNLKSH